MSAVFVVAYTLAAWLGAGALVATALHLAKCHVQSRTEDHR